MNLADALKWIHLIAAAVWTGGLITLAFLVVALRRADAGRAQIRAVARAFGRLSWTALAIAVATGVWQMDVNDYAYSIVTLKLTLAGIAAGLALLHQLTSRFVSPALRGIGQAVILLVSILIFGAAVAAFG
jgi:uncharacterized membrane protein